LSFRMKSPAKPYLKIPYAKRAETALGAKR